MRPVATSHTRICLSVPAVARRRPSGLNAIACTALVCPCSARSSSPLCWSQSLTVLSVPPLATILPSGLQATALICDACPVWMASSGFCCAAAVGPPTDAVMATTKERKTEECLGRKTQRIMEPLRLGDVPDTFANVYELIAVVGDKPE